MLRPVADYLRAQGWPRWHVALHRSSTRPTWFLFDNEHPYPKALAKLYGGADEVAKGRREAEVLQQLSRVNQELGIPALLFHSEVGADGYLVIQSGLPGRRLRDELDGENDAELDRQFGLVEGWLELFQARIGSGASVLSGLREAVSLCRERLPSLTAEEEALIEAAQRAAPELESVPAVAVHGDFWGGNVLLDRGRVFVIDWDNFHFGTPLEDPYQFVIGALLRRDRPDEETIAKVFAGRSRATQLLGQITARVFRRNHVLENLLLPFFLIFLLRRLAGTEFRSHAAWRKFIAHYVQQGMPYPFSVVRSAEPARVNC